MARKSWSFCLIFNQSTVKFPLNQWNSSRSNTKKVPSKMKCWRLVSKGREKNTTIEILLKIRFLREKVDVTHSYNSREGCKINHKINSIRSHWKYDLSSEQEKSRWSPEYIVLIWPWAGSQLMSLKGHLFTPKWCPWPFPQQKSCDTSAWSQEMPTTFWEAAFKMESYSYSGFY